MSEFRAPYTVPNLLCGACGQTLQYGVIEAPGIAEARCFTPRCAQRGQQLSITLPAFTDFEVKPVTEEA